MGLHCILRTILLVAITVEVQCIFQETSDASKVELNEDQINETFKTTDKDGDKHLDPDELQIWVQLMVDSHLKTSVPGAKAEFRSVDANRDKIVEWNEYRVVMKSLHNDDDHVYTEQEQRHKFRQADENGDGVLNQLEYVAFKNPMTTGYVLNRIAQELLDDFDTNKDGRVSLDEFVHHKASRHEDEDDAEISNLRKMEFQGAMDTNDDTFLDLREMKDYLNPRGSNFIKNEARHMMHESDTNRDRKLSLAEIKDNYLHFQTHKQNPVIKAIHDEF